MQEKIDGISVAKKEGRQWYIKLVKSSGADTENKSAMMAFKENKILWFQDSGDLRKILNLYIFDAETGEEQTYPLRPALKVLSVDW